MTPPINMNDLRDFLTERRQTIVDELHAGQRELNTAAATGPADYAEHAAGVLDQDMAIYITDRRSRQLAEVEKALESIDGETYGICTKCEGQISPARLRVMPTASLCIDCQQALEAKQSRRSNRLAPVWGNFTEIPYELAFEN